MKDKPRSMHVARISRTVKGKTYNTWLLRRTFREGASVKHETLANLSALPEHAVLVLQRLLKGEEFVSAEKNFEVTRSLPHGHVEAVLQTMRGLDLSRILGGNDQRKRDIVLALIAERILFPASKLASTRHWNSTTLSEELGLTDATVDEVYGAMDWLVDRQKSIEKQLARRHLQEEGLALYDVSSSYYEGSTCPLARHGHNRDGKKGQPIIVYGLLTNGEGCPVAVEVYPGNTGDPKTVPDQVGKIRDRFGIERVVLVGDRGMLTDIQIKNLKDYPGLSWISALRHNHLVKLQDEEKLEKTLFDEENLAEIQSPDFPGERLVVCFNLALGEERSRKREDLLVQTEKKLEKLRKEVEKRKKKQLTAAQIALKAGAWLNKWKMKKHFDVQIGDGSFAWNRNPESIEEEKALDGIYVIRTSEPANELSAEDAVRNYKRLAHVEAAFRTLKGTDMMVRPIHHRLEDRVKAHILLCMLAYYVGWHMRRALAPLLFSDENLEEFRKTRDPVAPATISESGRIKKEKRTTESGLPIHSFRTMIQELGTRARVTFRVTDKGPDFEFTKLTELNPYQREVFKLLEETVTA